MGSRQKFNGSSTTSEVLHGLDLSGKVILITGATGGLGYESALSLSKHGAEIVLCGRSENTCRTAKNKILEIVSDANIFTVPMESSSLASVKQGANIIRNKYKAIDILILNAGVSYIGNTQTTDGLESVFQINHLSHFYLTLLLEDLLIPGSRVVLVSSVAHFFSFLNRDNISEERLNPTSDSRYIDFLVYADSKLCNILNCLELRKRWRERKIDVFSCHPGNLVNTDIVRKSCWLRTLFYLVSPLTKSVSQAAATIVHTAVATELKGSNEIYFVNCDAAPTSQNAKDEILAKKLWDLSEKLATRICGSIDSGLKN